MTYRRTDRWIEQLEDDIRTAINGCGDYWGSYHQARAAQSEAHVALDSLIEELKRFPMVPTLEEAQQAYREDDS